MAGIQWIACLEETYHGQGKIFLQKGMRLK